MEPVAETLDRVLGPQVACHRMGMGNLDYCLRLAARDHQQGFLLPPPLGDTVKQAIVHDKMWRWVGCWLKLLSFRNPHLSPTVLKAIVLVLLLGETPGSSHLLEQIKIEVMRGTGDSPPLGLSEASSTGRRRAFLPGFRVGRFPARLAG